MPQQPAVSSLITIYQDLQLLDFTTTAIGSGGNYTSAAWIDVRQYARITCIAFVTTTGGNLNLQQSGDATNADFTTTQAITAATGAVVTFTRNCQWVKLNYVQGAGASGVIRIYMYGSTS